MRILHGPYSRWEPPATGTAVTVGVFDGVHRGHRATLRRLRERSGGRPIVVATFAPHPATVLAPDRAPRLLTTPGQRLRLFEDLGVDVVAILEFNEDMRLMSAESFVDDILVRVLRAEVIVIGSDFRFGHQGEGDVDMLHRMAAASGYVFEAVDLEGGETPISSTAIRRLLTDGRLDEATQLLGRPYSVAGVVVAGDGRGKSIGVPTANLELDPDQFIPKRGVYAVTAQVGGRGWRGVCNVGIRPTFGGSREIVEVHILEFDDDIYGSVLEVEFLHRIRDERQFEGVDALVAQIHRDITEATALLGADESVG